jgi:hypothetical protein
MGFYETSAKDNFMVEEAYFAMARRILNQVDENKGSYREVAGEGNAQRSWRAMISSIDVKLTRGPADRRADRARAGHFGSYPSQSARSAN